MMYNEMTCCECIRELENVAAKSAAIVCGGKPARRTHNVTTRLF